MVCLVALDEILWFVLRRMDRVSFERYFGCHFLLDRSSDPTRFRIPLDVIPSFEGLWHWFGLSWGNSPSPMVQQRGCLPQVLAESH
jgi:hypothetical protein